MAKKLLTIFSAVALAAVSLWLFTGADAAPTEPNAIEFSVELDKESLKLGDGEDTSFNVLIIFARTEETGENPFQIRIPVPAGTSLNGKVGDIKVTGNEVENSEVILEGGIIFWQSEVGDKGGVEIIMPLKVDKCPEGGTSCKIDVIAMLKDGKEQSSTTSDSLIIDGDFGPATKSDFLLEVSGIDLPANQYKVTMQYRRKPGTGLNPFLMGFLMPKGADIVGEPKVELDDADGFLLQRIEDFLGFEGTVDEDGGVQVSFLLEITECPSGAKECLLELEASLKDGADNVVVNHEEINYIGETEKNGKLNLGLDLIGAGQIGGTWIVDTELDFTRDGGEGELEGVLKILMPAGASTQLGNFEIQDLKADVGSPTQEGQTILLPVTLLPNATVKILLPIGLDIGLCNNEVCTGEVKASFEYGDGESVDVTTEYSEKVGESADDKPNVTLDISADSEVINPGDEVELNIYIEEIPSGVTRMPGNYGFLLEVAGMKTTGDINVTLSNAGPEKVVYDEKLNGLKWEGEIGPEGSISVQAMFKADHCSNGGSCSADARLTVILPDGTEMIVKDSILIEDNSGFDPDNVEFKAAFLPTGETALESFEDFNKLPIEGACLTECEGILLGVKNGNSDPAEVFITIEFSDHLKIGPPDGYKLQNISSDDEKGLRTARLRVVAGVSKVSAFIMPVQIDPKSSSELTDDQQMQLAISTCVQPVGSNICEAEAKEELNERSPQNLLLLYLIWRSRDFGDAPSNNNHFGVQMESYPGEAVNPVAKFPLARDLSILNPPPNQIRGPAHRLSNLFHLGAGVSPEFAIDRNWDADFTNNIEPSLGTDQADFDNFDDGVDISAISFTDCGSTDIPVEVTITPLIIDFYTDKDADGLAHINIWLDSDRDGQWGYDNLTTCGFGNSVSEHIVVDAVVDPIALGVGTHTVMVNAPRVPWTNIFDLDQHPAWMRVMLTAIESNKDLYIAFGDGRGEEFVYFAGETEDYYYVAPDVVSSSSSAYTADMTLDVDLIRPGANNANEELLEFPGVEKADGQMVIRFRNDGYKAAEALIIDGDFGPATAIIFGKMTNLKCDGCTSSDPKGVGTGQVSWEIDKLEPGEFGEIILGWTGCLTCTRSAEDVAATATISVKSKQDFRPLNNIVSLKWPPINRLAPRIDLGWTGCLTCIRSVDDAAMAGGFNFIMNAPNRNAEKLIVFQDGEDLGKVFEMCDGVPCEDLGFMWGGDGASQFTFKTVDGEGKESPASKPIGLGCTNDIIRGSLMIFDQTTGQRSVIPAEAYDDLDNLIIWLANGRKFKAVVGYCGDDPDPKLSMTVNGTEHAFTLNEELLGYKLYETSFLLEVSGRATTSIGMSVESNGTTYEDSFQAGEPMGGHVLDAATGKAISGAKILVLEEQTVEFGDETTTTMVPWESIGIGQQNPISTNSAGFYEISVPNGTYQIEVIADGYQSYRSAVLEVTDHMIAGDIKLIEARPAPSNINISINESGFDQTVVQVEKGWVVKFINSGSDLHGAASAELGESSGLMAPGESFKMAFNTAGTFEITDPANGNRSIIVQVVTTGHTIYLPIILR
ncbi:MAG: hypothetical protein AB8G95_26140 [Anaerolineae bacterium]